MSPEEKNNFIYDIINREVAPNHSVATRFPPEPNGYLHIGHAKAIVLNFDCVAKYHGTCNLRFDDTNPARENSTYTAAIQEDIAWLGYSPSKVCYASDYFETLYQYALIMVKNGDAYVDSISMEQLRAQRGTPTQVGQNSPHRERSIAENERLFREMRAGLHPEGSLLLRAKIDMSHPNLNMRDPVMYRILNQPHHRCGSEWPIYPMYDFAHGQSDAIEGISHSLCTLEFENHRPLYNWFISRLPIANPPHQYEYARLNLSHTLLSKRRLQQLVDHHIVDGWGDPRLPTLGGMRRRGYPPAAIKAFCRSIGVTKVESLIDISQLEYWVREHLNKTALRYMVIFNPLKVIIENWDGDGEYLSAVNNPEDPSAGTRSVKFTRELYIEQEDFMLEPLPKYFRLAPGREVRLQHAYYLTCTSWKCDHTGTPIEVSCTYDPASKGGLTLDGRKVRGTLHWLSVEEARPIEVRSYDRLFQVPDVAAAERKGTPFNELLTPQSVSVQKVLAEPLLATNPPQDACQFMRKGYYCYDPTLKNGKALPVYHSTVGLRDQWKKIAANAGAIDSNADDSNAS